MTVAQSLFTTEEARVPSPAWAGKGGVPGSGEGTLLNGGLLLRNTVLTVRL